MHSQGNQIPSYAVSVVYGRLEPLIWINDWTVIQSCSLIPFPECPLHILNSSIFPDELKIAKVIPVYKSSEADKLQNYRPISLLPAISKVFEKIMYNKIVSFLNSKHILSKHQYGFRQKHSTIHPIIHLLSDCANNINSCPKQYTMSILCDLSKAFDVINHKILIQKMNHYGIRGIAENGL